MNIQKFLKLRKRNIICIKQIKLNITGNIFNYSSNSLSTYQ